jgi:hypothetical protein
MTDAHRLETETGNPLMPTTAVVDCPECPQAGPGHTQLELLADGGATCPNCSRWWADAKALVEAAR